MGNSSRSKAERNGTANEKFLLISDEKLMALYRNLLQCGRLKPGGKSSDGKNGAGRDRHAALVGTAIDLGPGDLVCSLDRHVVAGVSGEEALKALLRHRAQKGRAGGNAKNSGARNGAAALAPSVIGTALANKTAKNGKVAVVYCDGQAADCVRDAIHIASVHALPIVFVLQSDGAKRRRAVAARKTKSTTFTDETPWFPSITVDTHDVVAVYRVANEAISRARLGRGPTVIECRPFRVSGGSGNGNGKHWDDPVRNMEHYLRARGLFGSGLKEKNEAVSPK